jgi:hypothetical protein
LRKNVAFAVLPPPQDIMLPSSVVKLAEEMIALFVSSDDTGWQKFIQLNMLGIMNVCENVYVWWKQAIGN